MRRLLLITILCSFSLFADDASDLRNAREVFERNLAAIRNKDREAYLAVYLKSDRLVRTGPAGFSTGYDELARVAGGAWPDMIEATDIRLTPIRPGVVYGSYRYRVRYGTNEASGISERLFLQTPDGWRVALTGAVETPGIPPSPRAITGATLIDGRGGAPVKNASVIVRDGKIECAGADCAVPDEIDVVDARGMWITPGLVDAHVHFSQTGWADGRPDSLDVRGTHPYEQTVAALKANPGRFAMSYLCSGITGAFDVGGYAWTLKLPEETWWPHVTAAGPLLSTSDHWLNLPAERQFIHLNSEDAARGGVRYLAAQGAKAVKVWYLEDNQFVAAAGDEAAKAKLPLIVHATELALAKKALRAGAKLLVHSVWDVPVDDELIALMKTNGAILTPTLTVMGGYLRMHNAVVSRALRIPAIDDPNKCVDAATVAKVRSTPTVDMSLVNAELLERRRARYGERERMSAANLKRLAAAGIPIATGTDAGNPLTLHGPSIYAEMDAMQAAGMTPMQVIVASTSVAARAALFDGVTGTIEKGKDADLLILSADPSANVANFRKLRSVMRGGVLRGIEDLSAMAQGGAQ